MNGQEMLNELNILTGENIDSETGLMLFNLVKDIIEGERPWRMLIKEDSSNTFTSADTYLTAKDLPSDFLYDYKVMIGSDRDAIEYLPIPFEARRRYQDNAMRYYIDLASDKIHVCGKTDSTKTIYLIYIYETDDIALDTSPVWKTKFHRIIPLLSAEIHKAGIDIDEINIKGALQMSDKARMLYQSMVAWDTKLKLRSMDYQTPPVGGLPISTNRIDLES